MARGSDFEVVLLPYDVKEEMCLSLLAEFGADRVKKSGDELVHRCVMPWHDDRNPSARLNVEKLTYKCWSCDSGGGLLWLIKTLRRGTSTKDAFDWVSSTTGLDGDDLEAFADLIDAMTAEDSTYRAPMPSFSRRVLDPWAITHPWLTDPRQQGGRGIPEANVEALEMGYAEAYPLDDKGRTSERIIIPHFWHDRLVGWQSRRLLDDGTPKYLSTEDFPKDETIFRPPSGDTIVVVEAPMSVARHLHHQPVAATFGASVTDAQVRLLAVYDRVILFPDPDTAGWRWITGAIDEETGEERLSLVDRLEPYTDVDVVQTDWAVDAADMDDETMAELVAEAVPAALWEQPERLRCWDCKTYHSGHCREEG